MTMIDAIAHLGLLEDEAIMLDAAALELAALDHPGVDLDDYVETLAEMTERALAAAAAARMPADQAAVLARVIGTEFGFRGDARTYDDPANADMIRVIDRRRGLPVALAILYVAVARRVGWAAYALNTPGHVLVSVVDDETVLIDPFEGGAAVDATRLAGLLASVLGPGAVLNPEHLAPMSNRATLVRLLMNQASRAEQKGDSYRALDLFRRITTMAPGNAHSWWERARLELAHRRLSEARGSLSAMLETTRDPELRTHINAALDAIARAE